MGSLCLCHLPEIRGNSTVVDVYRSVGGQAVHHDDRSARVIVNHRPEVDDGVDQRHLRHDERISLLVTLQQSTRLRLHFNILTILY